MKIPTPVLILATFCLFLPLRAQPAPDATAPDATSAAPPVTEQPRNIMPLSINHKPNPTNPPPEIAGQIDKFFKGLEAGNYADSYDAFLANTRIGAQKEKMSVFISKTQEAFGLYGKLNDYEIFDNYSVGSNILVLTYLTRHDVQPLRWRFIYYRAEKTWHVINMGFDDVLLDMLD